MSKASGTKAGKAKTKTTPAAAKKAALANHVKTAKAAKASAVIAKAAKAPAAKTVVKKVAPKAAVKSSLGKPHATKSQAAKATASKSPAKGVPPKASVKAVPAKASGPAAIPPRTTATAKPVAPMKTEGTPKKMVARAKPVNIVLPPDYRPSDDEPFMNDMHRAYFRKRLLDWKDDILRQTRETLAILHEDSTQHADLADRATSETDRATELRTRDRQRKLIAKIDAAIGRIDDGSYGYCEDTGEPIGLKRLDARPIATLSVEAQERHERREKVYREE
jgi:DnaK suppressor protein